VVILDHALDEQPTIGDRGGGRVKHRLFCASVWEDLAP
jgi:hypothetical protein